MAEFSLKRSVRLATVALCLERKAGSRSARQHKLTPAGRVLRKLALVQATIAKETTQQRRKIWLHFGTELVHSTTILGSFGKDERLKEMRSG